MVRPGGTTSYIGENRRAGDARFATGLLGAPLATPLRAGAMGREVFPGGIHAASARKGAAVALAATLSAFALAPHEYAYADGGHAITDVISDSPSSGSGRSAAPLSMDAESVVLASSTTASSSQPDGDAGAPGSAVTNKAEAAERPEPGKGTEGGSGSGEGSTAGAGGESGSSTDSATDTGTASAGGVGNSNNDANNTTAGATTSAVATPSNAFLALDGTDPAEETAAVVEALAATPRGAIVDQESLFAAIDAGEEAVTLGGSFTISQPISIPDGCSFNLTLAGNTLTCTGSAFATEGEATIVVMGPGTLKADANLVANPGGSVNFTQVSGNISAGTLFSATDAWTYYLMGGSLSLSSTLSVGADSSMTVGTGASFSSSTGGTAVKMLPGSSPFKVEGTFAATGTGFQMDTGTNLSISSKATVRAGGDAIVASTNCDITIGTSASLSAGKKVLAVSGSGAGTSVESGPNVSLSDGTIAKYLATGVVVDFDTGIFSTLQCSNPDAQGWYGSIDSIWCPTQTDYDELLKLLPNGIEHCTRYTVAFVGDDGSVVGNVSVRKGHCVGDAFTPSAPSAPSVAGKKFECWKDAAGKACDAATMAALPVNADCSYVAHYVEDKGSGSGGTGEGGTDPVDPNPPVGPVEPVEPDPPVGPVGPGSDPVGPQQPGGNTGSGTGTGTGGAGNGTGTGAAGGSGSGGSVGSDGLGGSGASGTRTPGANPFAPWNPPGLALAAGFTVPAAGPGVLYREAAGPQLPDALSGKGAQGASGAGSEAEGAAGSADADGSAERAAASAFDAAEEGLPFGGAALARVLALAGGVALAALLVSRISRLFAATRTRDA